MVTRSQVHIRSERLPERFRPLFWSYRFEDLDTEKNEKTVIVQLVNFGTLADWQWLVRQYGKTEVQNVLESIPETEIRTRTRALASLLFSISHWEHAYRGAH